MVLSDLGCKEIFRMAYEKRYTWPKTFNGYKGECSFSYNQDSFKGKFSLGRDFKPSIYNISEEEIVKSIASQLFEFSVHRVKRQFDEIHLKNNFKLIKETKKGIEILVEGKNKGDKYRVLNERINMVFRKIHGIIIEVFVDNFFDTGNGFLSTKYTSQQIDPLTFAPRSHKFFYEDSFVDLGEKIWILNSRTIKFEDNNGNHEVQKYLFNNINKN